MNSRFTRRRNRFRGVECVEVALTLPLLLLLLFPVLHMTHRWHVEKMLKIATYEAIKAGGAPDGTRRAAMDTFREYANAFGIQGAALHIPGGNNPNSVAPDQQFRFRATAPAASNQLSLPLSLNFSSEISSGWVFYRKEDTLD